MAERKDIYSNILYNEVNESAANTITFEEIKMGLNLFDKVALLISRIEWYQWWRFLAATTDEISFGLSSSDGWSVPTPKENSIIGYHTMTVTDYGTAGNNRIWHEPMVDDYSTLPGKGILITPTPLFSWVRGQNLGSAGTIRLRVYFTVVKLKPEEYLELLETRQFFG